MSTVSIKNVTKVYDDETVIDTFNAEIKDGEFITLLGPSGCGKTTLLRMIAGFRKPSTGSISIAGKTRHRYGLSNLRGMAAHERIRQRRLSAENSKTEKR